MVDHEGHPIHLGPKALFDWPWLLEEISRLLPYAVNEPHVAEVGGVLVTESD